MTAARDFEDLRYALEHFSPQQARRLRLIISQDEELAEALPERHETPEDEGSVPDDILALIGSVDTGRTDAAERHDDYIRERMQRRYPRSV
ncbi:hypothetical protein NLX86_21470 [Streptomyces sp. A3M-1-3]|uniref:hypothetical protein n=1 Tax=Streptomyces sp. A3M-1-3 TaxID=2962044 RepID=UPI0020B732C4|nr:hypothetical protein [Streptomyces sp. A3M-1-3]MCP3820570.1 hypothetical protein [Streptomyces sp. A3M-1-3]